MKFNKSLLLVVAFVATLALGSGLALARDGGANELDEAVKALKTGANQMVSAPAKKLPPTCAPQMLEGAKVLEQSSSENAKMMVKGQKMMMDGHKMMMDGHKMIMDGEKGMKMEMKK